MREFPSTSAPPLMYFDDELDEAAVVLEAAIRAAEKGETAPSELPRSIIPLFRDLGKSLRDDEFPVVSSGTRGGVARYDVKVKERILEWAATPYTDFVDVAGEVRATDLDGLKFTLRLGDGSKVTGRFKPEQEAAVLEAIGEHTSRRIRVRGIDEFEPEDGNLAQIVDVEQVELIGPEEMVADQLSPTAQRLTIFERLSLISEAAPKDTWKDVPTDLSINVRVPGDHKCRQLPLRCQQAA
jgi:hypothetical protein